MIENEIEVLLNKIEWDLWNQDDWKSKRNESGEAKDTKVEVELSYDILHLEVIQNTRDCVVP